MEKLKPLGDGVLVRLAKAEDVSPGGIVIPDAAKEKPRRGEVLAVGPGTPLTWPQPYITTDGQATPLAETMRRVAVKPGDVVLFSVYAGTPIHSAALTGVEPGDLLLLKESDLLAVVEPPQPIDCASL